MFKAIDLDELESTKYYLSKALVYTAFGVVYSVTKSLLVVNIMTSYLQEKSDSLLRRIAAAKNKKVGGKNPVPHSKVGSNTKEDLEVPPPTPDIKGNSDEPESDSAKEKSLDTQQSTDNQDQGVTEKDKVA